MNGFIPAVLGCIVLIAIVVVLLRRKKTGRQENEIQPVDGQADQDASAAAVASLAGEKRDATGKMVEAEASVVVEEEPSSAVEALTQPLSDQSCRLEETVVDAVDVELFPQETIPDVIFEPVADAKDVGADTQEPQVGATDKRPAVAEAPTVTGKGEKERDQEGPFLSADENIEEKPGSVAEAAVEGVEERGKDIGGMSDPAPLAAKSAKTDLVRMSVDIYMDRLNTLEEQQRAALAVAIEQNDDGQRDHLQRELVIMNDRLALLADSYVKDMACYQQVLDELIRLRAEDFCPPDVDQAIEALQAGNAQDAATFLDKVRGQAHPFAVRAAYLSGQLAECLVDLRKAMECYQQAVLHEPDNVQYLWAAGMVARSLYRTKDALPWLERYAQLIKDDGHAGPKAMALAQRELAYTHVLAGQYQKAGPLYKESMTVLAQKLGQDHPEMAVSWQQIGEFQETMGEYDKAISLYKKSLAILEKKRGLEHPALAGILRKLAALCMELEMESEAVPLYERLVRIQEKALRPTHPQLMVSLKNLAETYHLQRRYAESEACYLKTLRINEEVYGKEHPSVAVILQELAKLCTSQRREEEADQYQKRATAIFQKSVETAEKKAGAEEVLTLELS